MSWSVVTTATSGTPAPGNVSSIQATAGTGVSVGDVIVVAFGRSCSSLADIEADTFTDNLGNSYTQMGGDYDSANGQGIVGWYSIATHAGTPTFTDTYNSSFGYGAIKVVVLRSTITPSYDTIKFTSNGHAGSTSTNGDTIGTVSPAADGDALVASFIDTAGTGDWSAGTTLAWTSDENDTGSAGGAQILEHFFLGSGTSGVAQTATATCTATDKFIAFVVAFKAPAASPHSLLFDSARTRRSPLLCQ